MYEDFIIYRDKIDKIDIGDGILMQNLGQGSKMNVLHWNMNDGNVVDWHKHHNEQFGYVIKGGFEVYIGDEKYTLEAGDGYFIPSDAMHKFIAVGETEAIDVFDPVRENLPG